MNTDDMRTFIIDGHKASNKEAQTIIKSKLEEDGALENFIDDNWGAFCVIGKEYKASEVAEAMEGRKKLLSTVVDFILLHPERMGMTATYNVRPKKLDISGQYNRVGKKWRKYSNTKAEHMGKRN